VVRSVLKLVNPKRQAMSRIDDAEIGPLRQAARILLINGRFWGLLLAEMLKRHRTLKVLPTDSTRPPTRQR
jgi:hypothetical protein